MLWRLGGLATKVASLSTMEAKYVAPTKDSKKVIWLQKFMEELEKWEENRRLYSDN